MDSRNKIWQKILDSEYSADKLPSDDPTFMKSLPSLVNTFYQELTKDTDTV